MQFINAITKKTREMNLKAGLALMGLFLALGTALPVHATDIDDLFTAADTTGLQTNIKTFLLAFIGIAVLFLGYRFVKRAMNRA